MQVPNLAEHQEGEEALVGILGDRLAKPVRGEAFRTSLNRY